jgi:peptidoglycan hydrolase-like protein with peptidoglycan-binding domain
MRKIIKLTESDLEQIVKKVLTEQGNMFGTAGVGIKSPFIDSKSYSGPTQPVNKNINPKGLKLGDGGNKNPQKLEDVKKLQQSLMDLGYLVTDTMTPTGYFGNLTNNALKAFYSKAEPTNKKVGTSSKVGGVAAGVARAQSKIGKVDASKTKQTITDFKDLKVSNQVKSQLNYMKSNNLLNGEKFTILDDKNSQVHAFLPGYKLVRTYYVITGKNKGDQLKTQTMTDWAMKNWTDVGAKFFSSVFKADKNPLQDVANYIDGCYFNQKEWNLKNTPSGVFKRAGNVTNFMNDLLATTFVEEDYGARFVTWETCNGGTIPFGFHGTKSAERLKNLPGDKNFSKEKCTKRKMSFGCVNFGDADVKEISSFITDGQLSIWLPDASDNIVEIPSTCVSGSAPQKSIMSYDYMTQKYGKGFK